MESEHSAKVIKQLTKVQTNSNRPGPKSKVIIKTWSSQKDPETSFQQQVTLGQQQLEPSVQKIITNMNVGEAKQIQIWNAFNQTKQFICLELCSILQEQVKSKANPFQIAKQKKQIGNSFFKNKQYPSAIKNYQQAYQFVQTDCRSQAIQLKLSVISNLAQANLSLGLYQACVQWCQKHLLHSVQKNQKILYREAKAEKGLKNWEGAIEIIKQATKDLSEIPDHFKQLLKEIEKAKKQQLAQTKKIYSGMFR